MQCPHCDSFETSVRETRRHEDEVWRRRRCLALSCAKTFVTREHTPTPNRWPEALAEKMLARLPPRPKSPAGGAKDWDPW